MSIEAEHQQTVIEKLVEVMPEEGVTVASHPLVVDPDSRIDTEQRVRVRVRVRKNSILKLA